jgi:hypothetical protein
MAIQTFTAGQVLTAAQVNNLQANDYNQTVSTKTANYTLAAADKGTRVVMNVSSASTITVNTSLFSAGDTVILQNIASDASTVTAGTATVTSAGPLAIPQYGSGTLYFTSASAAIFFPSAVTIPPAASGLVFIAGGTISGTTSVDNCFSATYKNYKIIFNDLVRGNTGGTLLRLRAGGSDSTTAVYQVGFFGQNVSTGAYEAGNQGVNQTSFDIGKGLNNADGTTIAFDIFNPFAAFNTQYAGSSYDHQSPSVYVIAGLYKATTSFDGFTLLPVSSTLDSGSYKVYGYANS